jgi:lambda family phage minor tail protein L
VPETIETLSQRAVTDEFVELFELDATSLGGSVNRFLAGAFGSSTVTWQGNTYAPIPVTATGFAADGSGTLPTPHLKVANVNLAFSGIAISFHDLLGCIVTRHRTFRRFLDGESEADPTAEYAPDVYRVDRKVAQNKLFVEWELATVIDQEGRKLPGRPVLQGACPWRTRHWTGVAFDYTHVVCPYVGATIFDVNGNVVVGEANEVFSKRIDTCCQKRFPTGSLPFGGFPGVGRFR